MQSNDPKDFNVEEILKGISQDSSNNKDTGVNLEFILGNGDEHVDIDEKVNSVEFTEESSAKDKEAGKKPTEQIPPEELDMPTELEVPDSFDVAEEESGPKIFTTYVPRFTEVSDKYHMSGAGKEPEKAEPEITVREVEGVSDKPISATAELDEALPEKDTKIVTMGTAADTDQAEQSTMFKFEDAPAPSVTVPPVQVEDASIEPIPGQPEQPVEEPEKPAEEQPDVFEPTSYVMPDPEIKREEPVAEVPVPRDDKHTEIGAPLERGRGLFEYSSLSQRDSVKDGFLDSILSKKLRILVACAIGIVLLLLENAYIFGIKIDQMLNLYGISGSMVILDLPFVVALALLTLPEICYSVRQIFSKKAVPELLLPISLIAIVGYYCAVLVNAPQSYPLFGLVYSILSIAALSASLFRKNADFMAFKAIANGMEKLIIDRKATRSLDSINRALDGKVESYKSETVHVYKTKFISDFKRRCKRISENSLNNLLLIAISLGVAIVGGIVALFIPGGIVSALHILCLIFFTSCPILLIFSHKIPYYFASRAASQEQSAVIGEGSLYEYSNVDVITFKDTEVFSDEDVNIQRIMLYGKSENLTKALQHMSSIFNAVGGPLEPIFSDSLDGRVSPATNVFVEDDGISGIYHGAHIRAGSLEYMLRNGVRVPEDTTESAGRQSIKVMYAAENGEVYAKFFIRYTLSEDFTMILPSMQDDGLVPLVYTRDPNINNELFRQLSAGKDSIRVLKQTSVPEEEIVHEKLSSGMVTMGDKVNVVNLIILSKKYVAFHSKLAVYELIATIVGVTLSLALAISGLAIVPTVVLGLWQVAWCFALYFISRHHFCGVNHKNSKVKDK